MVLYLLIFFMSHGGFSGGLIGEVNFGSFFGAMEKSY
jgi:hypothetical protein